MIPADAQDAARPGRPRSTIVTDAPRLQSALATPSPMAPAPITTTSGIAQPPSLSHLGPPPTVSLHCLHPRWIASAREHPAAVAHDRLAHDERALIRRQEHGERRHFCRPPGPPHERRRGGIDMPR